MCRARKDVAVKLQGLSEQDRYGKGWAHDRPERWYEERRACHFRRGGRRKAWFYGGSPPLSHCGKTKHVVHARPRQPIQEHGDPTCGCFGTYLLPFTGSFRRRVFWSVSLLYQPFLFGFVTTDPTEAVCRSCPWVSSSNPLFPLLPVFNVCPTKTLRNLICLVLSICIELSLPIDETIDWLFGHVDPLGRA